MPEGQYIQQESPRRPDLFIKSKPPVIEITSKLNLTVSSGLFQVYD